MTQTPVPGPQRPPLSTRLQPWVDTLYKLLVAMAAGLAIWRGLH
jgi:hypothetical protein